MVPHQKTVDLIERLRKWSIAVDAVPASDIMEEAAAELERCLITIDCYCQYAAAAEREFRRLRGVKDSND
jgi:hypothetical protein